MNKEEFVEKLKLLSPKKEDLKKYDLPDEFIDQIIDGYICIPKKIAKKPYSGTDVILHLLNHYDCSKLQIGLVRFLEEPIEGAYFYKIGKVDLDTLVINNMSLRIQVLDHDSTNHVLWEVASNSSNFLESLLIFSEYTASKIKNFDQQDDASLQFQCVIKCTEKAGGKEYAKFYKMLLGYFE